MQLRLLFNLTFIQALGKAVSLEIQASFKSELSGHRMNAAEFQVLEQPTLATVFVNDSVEHTSAV